MSTTQGVFNQIAASWYNFRHRSIFRNELEALAKRWQQGRLLNVGCGHGPDFIPFKNGFELYGIDFSDRMLQNARKYAIKYRFVVQLVNGDARLLPYADDSFDYAVAVATYHHIEAEDERLNALTELYRVLKPGGEAFITVWNKWQPKFWLKTKDVLVPWRSKDKTLYRYYYLFSYREIEELTRKAGFEVVESSPESKYNFPVKTFSRNICILVRKSP